MIHRFHDWLIYGRSYEPKSLKEPKHFTTVRNRNTSQQYCTVLMLVIVSVLVLVLVMTDFSRRMIVDNVWCHLDMGKPN